MSLRFSFLEPATGLLFAATLVLLATPLAQAQQPSNVRSEHAEEIRERREAELHARMEERWQELRAQIESETALPADSVIEQDSLALVALYNKTDGDNWHNNNGWLSAPVADWYSVTVSGDRVVELDLACRRPFNIGCGRRGSVPGEVGNLGELRKLDLEGNQLTGAIPPELGQLDRLQILYLGYNELAGPLPPELGQIQDLRKLDLSNNRLTGGIPPELGRLQNLESLNLEDNRLTGAIPPELGQLQNLESLALYINRLTGRLPPELGQLQKLEKMYLSSNELSGPIPLTFTNLTALNGFTARIFACRRMRSFRAGSMVSALGSCA